MSKFKWMPILRTGIFTDKNKQKVEIKENDLDRIISSTDLSKEPQFVIEHPKEDSIGFGTISQLKRVGDYLFALPKEVNEKFKSAVNQGKLPGRSVTLDKNSFALKNISFLPPEIEPAVSGLGTYSFQEVQEQDQVQVKMQLQIPGLESHFADLESGNYEFASYEVSNYPFKTIQTIIRNIKNFFIEKYSLEDADQVIPEYFLNEVGEAPRIFQKTDPPTVNPSFSQNQNGDKMKIDLTKIDFSKLDPQLKEAIEGLQAELSTTTVQLQAATSKLTTAEKEKIKNEVLQFCESPEVKLKIKPADKDKVVNFLIALKEQSVIEFSAPEQGGTTVQLNAYEFATGLIKSLPDVIELSELATNSNANSQSEPDYRKQAKEIADFVKR